MFNSTGNNFGAGVIQFKDVQESNYIVLNAKFTCNPQSAEYQAAEVLEISVPKLSISRSTIAGVVARFKYSETSYGYTNIYDAGTVLKSWVKDANTICIEKLSIFDDRQELIIYIQTLYCMLGQGGNASKGKEKRITRGQLPPAGHILYHLRSLPEMDLLPHDVWQLHLGLPGQRLGGVS